MNKDIKLDVEVHVNGSYVGTFVHELYPGEVPLDDEITTVTEILDEYNDYLTEFVHNNMNIKLVYEDKDIQEVLQDHVNGYALDFDEFSQYMQDYDLFIIESADTVVRALIYDSIIKFADTLNNTVLCALVNDENAKAYITKLGKLRFIESAHSEPITLIPLKKAKVTTP